MTITILCKWEENDENGGDHDVVDDVDVADDNGGDVDVDEDVVDVDVDEWLLCQKVQPICHQLDEGSVSQQNLKKLYNGFFY